jgi:uncharacterized membrane protein HdeD (DUF308 family)
MPFTTGNKNIVMIINFINKPVLISYSSRSITGFIEFKKFRLSNSLIRGAFYAFNKFKYLFENLLVINRPVTKILKGIRVESKLSHLSLSKSFARELNSSSEKTTVSLGFSRLTMALLMRSLYALWLSFFVKPKSGTGEMEISNAFSFLNSSLILSKKSVVSSFDFIRIIVSIYLKFSCKDTYIENKRKINWGNTGIRKVNGAKTAEIMTMLNKDFIKWVVVAFVISTPVAYYGMKKWLESFAYKASLSWWIFALAGVLALVIALLTVSWQSWKAAMRNPVEALRYE